MKLSKALGNVRNITSRQSRSTSSITVVCRKRPLLENEIMRGEKDNILLCENNTRKIKVSEIKKDITGTNYSNDLFFEYDRSFGGSHSTEDVYLDCVQPIVAKFLLSGGKNSVFTYGQTGSGKTYSMLGCPRKQQQFLNNDILSDNEEEMSMADINGMGDENEYRNNRSVGFLQMAVQEIFDKIGDDEVRSWVRVSCYEIYLNKVFDLFNNRKQLRSLEGANGDVAVHGLQFEYCSSSKSVVESVNKALKTRITGSNARNKTSSRGHLVCQLELVHSVPVDESQGAAIPVMNESDNIDRHKRRSLLRNRTVVSASMQASNSALSVHPPNVKGGKLAFIDLAGAERGGDAADSTNLRGGTNGDGANINKSLLALKECIRAIDAGSHHVPFRDSILTKVLREYLVPADAHTLMMVHVTPASSTIQPAINSLHYASMVLGLRKRCQPLLNCKPPVPNQSEVYCEHDTEVSELTNVQNHSKQNRSALVSNRRYSSMTAKDYQKSESSHKVNIRHAWNNVIEYPDEDEDVTMEDGNNENRLDDLLPTPPRLQNDPYFHQNPPQNENAFLSNPTNMSSSSIQPPAKRVIRSDIQQPDVEHPQVFKADEKEYPPSNDTNDTLDKSHLSLFYNSPQYVDVHYPDLSQLKMEIQNAQHLFRTCGEDWKVLIEQKHKLTIIIGELMFTDYDRTDIEQLRFRTHVSRLATSVEGEMYICIKKRLDLLESEFNSLII